MSESNDLQQVQLDLEAEAVTLGVERYNKRLEEEGQEAMPPGIRLIKEIVKGRPGVPGLAEKLAVILKDAAKAVASPAAAVYDFMKQFSPEELAYVAARQGIHAMSCGLTVQRAAMAIAKALENSENVAGLQKASPMLYRRYLKAVAKKTSQRKRVVVLRKHQEYAAVKVIRWDQASRLKLGHLLLSLLKESEPGIIEFVPSHNEFGKAGPLTVQATEWAEEWLRKSHEHSSVLFPLYMPMVVPPRPWSGPFEGGYLTKPLQYALVKKAKQSVLNELKRWKMPKVYAAINALQKTEWSINTAVLNVVLDMWETGGGKAGLPPRENVPLPEKDFPYEVDAKDPRLKAWRAAAAKVYEENYRLRSQRRQVFAQLGLAQRMAGFEKFYFPHALDWRGRAYPVSSHLTPQSNDLGKSLLRFTNGCPLGDNGAYWLAVHGANCYGVDKTSFEERVQWVQEHEEDILATTLDPFHTQGFWTGDEVGDPWQFLAFCLEWSGLVMWVRSGREAAEYVSHLPVGLDGSCNGLQHFSAMLRDEIGGKATNLVPAEKPSDIYAAVAAAAQRLIDEKAAGGDEVAQKWVGKITRKITKRNTMTVPYGVTQIGMKDQLRAEFMKLGQKVPDAECRFLAEVNHTAIGQVVVAAREAMGWLRGVAKVSSKTGKAIRWVTPSGMLAVQDYREILGKRITSFMTGSRVALTLSVEGDRLDKRRMGLGISPNFVHSLDASHMVSTVVSCVEKGMQSFAMVHDSYGTHAGNIDVLGQTLRETFVEQYEGNLLEHYRSQLVAQLPEELAEEIPPCPNTGSLELAAVLNSDYFFA